jgi:steroid 5-alpha reductase family enzyme
MPINEVHARIGNSAILFMLIAGLWGLWRWSRRQGVNPNYLGMLLVGEGLMLVQGVIGVYMWLVLQRAANLERPGMHFLYGILTVLTLPAAYSFIQGKLDPRREQFVYALVCLFLAGLLWRAMTTGVPPMATLVF